MGIITIVLVSGGFLQMTPDGKLPDIPLWVVLSAHAAIGLGTLSGGWRIVKTMGTKIVKLQPVRGFCAETAGAMTLFGATAFRHSGLDDTHHHRLDRRRRFGKTLFGREMGRRRTHRLGVGADHPDGRHHRSCLLRHHSFHRKAARHRLIVKLDRLRKIPTKRNDFRLVFSDICI